MNLNDTKKKRTKKGKSYLEDGDPRVANVVERNCTFERILVTGTALGVILVPIDARRIVEFDSTRNFAQQIDCSITYARVVYVRWYVVARRHATAFSANEAVSVIGLVKNVLKRLV